MYDLYVYTHNSISDDETYIGFSDEIQQKNFWNKKRTCNCVSKIIDDAYFININNSTPKTF